MRISHLLLLATFGPSLASAQALVLDTGAVVRAQLDSATVIGEVRHFYADSSSQLVMCPIVRNPCAHAADLLIVPTSAIKNLSVRGKQTGGFGLMGFYLGALLEIGISRRTDGLLAGGFGGAALGAFIGSKSIGWVPIFPCAHACAAGRYPEPRR